MAFNEWQVQPDFQRKGCYRLTKICELCCRLFEDNVELLDLFEKFANLRTKREQEESLELAEHATMVMNTLDNAIRTLDNPDAFVQFVEQVGASHRRIPGFNKEHFWVSILNVITPHKIKVTSRGREV